MYSYGIKGWKSGGSNTAVLKTFGKGCSFINEDDEDQDGKPSSYQTNVPPPGEYETTSHAREIYDKTDAPVEQSPAQRQSSQAPIKIFAKDKRRLREKRRSTGIAGLISEKKDGDEETMQNTSYNEEAGHHVESVAIDRLRMTEGVAAGAMEDESSRTEDESTHAHDDARHQQLQQQQHDVATSVYGSSLSSRSAYSIKSTLNPVIEPSNSSTDRKPPCIKSAKPTLPSKPTTSSRSQTGSGYFEKPVNQNGRLPCVQCAKKSEEELKLHIKIQELEKQLANAHSETSVLIDLLANKDAHILALETEVRALNEDLDLADEDYIRIEEENKALLRGMSQIDIE